MLPNEAAAIMSTQDTFVSHLVELRDRLLRAILAVLVVFLCLFPWAKDLYTVLIRLSQTTHYI